MPKELTPNRPPRESAVAAEMTATIFRFCPPLLEQTSEPCGSTRGAFSCADHRRTGDGRDIPALTKDRETGATVPSNGGAALQCQVATFGLWWPHPGWVMLGSGVDLTFPSDPAQGHQPVMSRLH